MATEVAAVLDYLRPSHALGWGWAEEGVVATWRDQGGTIAYLPELIRALEHGAEEGLPAIDALVLAFAACADSWPQREAQILRRLESILGPGETTAAALHELRHGLPALHALPPALRHGIEARAQLMAALFGGAPPGLRPPAAGELLRCLHQDLPAAALQDLDPDPNLHRCREALLGLAAAVAKLDPDALQHRIATGMDAAPEPAPISLDHRQAIGAALAEIAAEDWPGLARLVRELRVAVRLPRQLSQPDALRVGGVADISNRGRPDRLLLSELANDDELLTLRLALGEALYLEAEPPAAPPPGLRHILLEDGIRLWGCARPFAVAVALALALDLPAGGQLAVHAVGGDQHQELDLRSASGLRALLERLGPAPRPAAGLAQALADDEPGSERVLVCHADTWADPQAAATIRAAFGATARHSLAFIVTVDANGSYRLLRHGVHGEVEVARATLSLSGLDQTAAVPLRDADAELPAAFRAPRWPLRVVRSPYSRTAIWREHTLYSIDPRGVLLAHDAKHRGARVLARCHGQSEEVLLASWGSSEFTALGWSPEAGGLLDLLDLHLGDETLRAHAVPFPQRPLAAHREACCWWCTSGARSRSTPLPDVSWRPWSWLRWTAWTAATSGSPRAGTVCTSIALPSVWSAACCSPRPRPSIWGCWRCWPTIRPRTAATSCWPTVGSSASTAIPSNSAHDSRPCRGSIRHTSSRCCGSRPITTAWRSAHPTGAGPWSWRPTPESNWPGNCP
jgi:hypothetical protein